MLIIATDRRGQTSFLDALPPSARANAAPRSVPPRRAAVAAETPADRESARMAEKARLEAADGRERFWHLGQWMYQMPQTPWTGRCACGECGGVALLPVGTVLSFRGASMRVADWAPQDHWNVPCIDAEGGVFIGRDSLTGGPRYTLADAEGATARAACLASLIPTGDRATAFQRAERVRLEANSAAWRDLAQRLGAGNAAERLNPTNHVGTA